VIDFRFTEIEAELSVTLEHLEALDRQLSVITKNFHSHPASAG
jgi:hypothetical protein